MVMGYFVSMAMFFLSNRDLRVRVSLALEKNSRSLNVAPSRYV